MSNEKIKMLIELSETVAEADEYIEKYSGFTDISQKLAFLTGLIPCSILSRDTPDDQENDSIVEDDYYCVLYHIIERKWRTSVSAAR